MDYRDKINEAMSKIFKPATDSEVEQRENDYIDISLAEVKDKVDASNLSYEAFKNHVKDTDINIESDFFFITNIFDDLGDRVVAVIYDEMDAVVFMDDKPLFTVLWGGPSKPHVEVHNRVETEDLLGELLNYELIKKS